MRQLTVRLSDEEYEVLSRFCEENGYSKVKLIRSLIRRFISGERSKGKERVETLKRAFGVWDGVDKDILKELENRWNKWDKDSKRSA